MAATPKSIVVPVEAVLDTRFDNGEMKPENISIHQRMASILAELPAIGKDQVNKQQGFKFRGYDDVLNALNPLLAKHGVFFVPRVLERVASTRTTKSGGLLYEVSLHVEYRFYGPWGDSVAASAWGEGTDSGDKSTAKALTGALKYVLFQVFAISTEEASAADGDFQQPEASTPTPQPLEGWRNLEDQEQAHDGLKEEMGKKPQEVKDAMNSWRKDNKVGWPMTKDQFDDFLGNLNAVELVLDTDLQGP